MNDLKYGYPVHLTDRIEQLMDDGTLLELFKIIEGEIDQEWKRTPPDAQSARELLYHELQALYRIQIKLQTIIDSLKYAKRG